jgi:hypothetical protein
MRIAFNPIRHLHRAPERSRWYVRLLMLFRKQNSGMVYTTRSSALLGTVLTPCLLFREAAHDQPMGAPRRRSTLAPSDIRRAEVKAVVAAIAAPVLANQVLAAASPIFSWAVRQEIIAANPCFGVEATPRSKRSGPS